PAATARRRQDRRWPAVDPGATACRAYECVTFFSPPFQNKIRDRPRIIFGFLVVAPPPMHVSQSRHNNSSRRIPFRKVIADRDGILVNATFVDAALNKLFAHWRCARMRATEAANKTFG